MTLDRSRRHIKQYVQWETKITSLIMNFYNYFDKDLAVFLLYSKYWNCYAWKIAPTVTRSDGELEINPGILFLLLDGVLTVEIIYFIGYEIRIFITSALSIFSLYYWSFKFIFTIYNQFFYQKWYLFINFVIYFENSK
jgi:hypothetical protein